MENLTLIIPAKNESESLPIFLNELKKYNCKKMIVLQKDDLKTIESLSPTSTIPAFSPGPHITDLDLVGNSFSHFFDDL